MSAPDTPTIIVSNPQPIGIMNTSSKVSGNSIPNVIVNAAAMKIKTKKIIRIIFFFFIFASDLNDVGFIFYCLDIADIDT